MELSPEQQKAIDEQKAQCIFCKIIKGEVPSKKVYEDEHILAILDINPATKGHLLVMPKEHYPIMPLIPEDIFKHLFAKARKLDKAVQEALLCHQTTIFIANGGAAGQQSSHFMMHIIPREGSDGLFEIKRKEAPETEVKEVFEKCQILNPMLQKNLAILGFIEGGPGRPDPQGPPGQGEGAPIPQNLTKEQLMEVIDQNPQIKQIILQSPDQFKKLVPQHPQLKQVFGNHDLDEIISMVQGKSKKKGKVGLEGIE